MKCREARQFLDDYADGSLQEQARTALEDHLRGCFRCRSEASQLKELIGRAGELPGGIPPRRDLWSDIRDRIEGERKAERPVPARARVRGYPSRRPALPVATAAALLILAAGSLLIPRLLDRGSGSFSLMRSDWQTGLLTGAAMEKEYVAVTEGLFYSVMEAGTELPESTLEVIDEHLQIIDDAIESTRIAFHNDPSDVELQSMLSAAHRRKVELLQWTTRLATLY